MRGKDIKCCPFCGNDEVEYSAKTGGDRHYADGSKKRIYHVSVYCTKCFTYGPRVLVKLDYDPNKVYSTKENIQEVQYVNKAINAWNGRA